MFNSSIEDLIGAEATEFYLQHQGQSIEKLLLKHSKEMLLKERVIQLDARNRAQLKLPSWYANPEIVFPPKQNLEQASSEAAAIYKASILDFKTSLDITGGTAVDSWQFAQKSEKHILVEPHLGLLRLAEHNLNALGCKDVSFVHDKAEQYLEGLEEDFDLIYIDPSRRKQGRKVFDLKDYSPNLDVILDQLVKHGKTVMIKISPMYDLTLLLKQFWPYISEAHVIAVKSECKEVLAVLKKKTVEHVRIFTINIQNNNTQHFSFFHHRESEPCSIAEELKTYLLEPNAAVLKAGAFNVLANEFNLEKIEKSSHLYTSQDKPAHFPGKVYEIIEVSAPFKLSKTYEPLSITTRNFPLGAEAIRKKLGWIDGQTYRLFATTMSNKKRFILCKAAVK